MDPNILSVDFAEVGRCYCLCLTTLLPPYPPTPLVVSSCLSPTCHRAPGSHTGLPPRQVIVDPSLTERNALIGLFVAVQQISCVRDRSGEIKEGAEDDIKLNKYFLVFQREYVAEEGELKWKVS